MRPNIEIVKRGAKILSAHDAFYPTIFYQMLLFVIYGLCVCGLRYPLPLAQAGQ